MKNHPVHSVENLKTVLFYACLLPFAGLLAEGFVLVLALCAEAGGIKLIFGNIQQFENCADFSSRILVIGEEIVEVRAFIRHNPASP